MTQLENLDRPVDNGDDEPDEQFTGPRLYVCDEDVRIPVVNGRGRFIVNRSLSRSDNLLIDRIDETHISGQLTIHNKGNSLASLCSVSLVLWGRKSDGTGIAGVEKILGYQQIERLDSKLIDIPKIDITKKDLGFSDFSEVSHIYAVVSEQMFDPLEPAAKDLLIEAKSNTRNFERNPCRLSRQVCCWTPSNANGFDIDGNKIIRSLDGGAEIVCLSAGVAPDVYADFSVYSPNSPSLSVYQIKAAIPSFNRVLSSGYIASSIPSEVVFSLYSSFHGDVVLSTSGYVENQKGCMVELHGDFFDLKWNESDDDNDYDDYIIRVIYR